ncbi:MAG: hypothetical protein M0042_11010 [Nitrospiraceae bacterium]|nr:hypothetical protein [Nitrospiraceae bacterium]
MKHVAVSLFVFVAFLSACTPVVHHVELTDAGAKVIFLGSHLPESMPGRPLDRCKLLQYMIIRSEFEYGCLGESDMINALRNRAAIHGANVAVLGVYLQDVGRVQGSILTCNTAVNGFAMFCDRDVLQAAGLTGIIETPINRDWVIEENLESQSGRQRVSHEGQNDSSSFDGRKGDRKRAAEQ